MHQPPDSEEELLEKHRRSLPHWNFPDSIYFVTWRLHKNQKKMEPDERAFICETLKHFDLKRYQLFSFVVMDDHVHVLFRPMTGQWLSKILHSWKSFTANRLQRDFKRRGSIWQEESYDRIVRNEREFYSEVRYILNNPNKRWQVEEYPWMFWRPPEESP